MSNFNSNFMYFQRVWLYVICGLFLTIITASCTASSVQVVKLALPEQNDTLSVFPTKDADQKLSSSDAYRRGLLGILVKKTGIYTYTFQEKDFDNLHVSIVKSLNESGAFTKVIDVQKENADPSGLKLYIVYGEAGISETGMFAKCVINGLAWVEDDRGKLVAKQEIRAAEWSGMSVRNAKNGAIKNAVKELSSLFLPSAAP